MGFKHSLIHTHGAELTMRICRPKLTCAAPPPARPSPQRRPACPGARSATIVPRSMALSSSGFHAITQWCVAGSAAMAGCERRCGSGCSLRHEQQHRSRELADGVRPAVQATARPASPQRASCRGFEPSLLASPSSCSAAPTLQHAQEGLHRASKVRAATEMAFRPAKRVEGQMSSC